MNITIKDVAKKAGVSPATVSRVLNNYNYVNEDTKEKVVKAMTELGYKPNEMARNFALQKTNTIGLIVSDITNPFYSELAKNITDRAKLFNYNVVLCNTDNKKENQDFYIDFLRQKGVDGIIFSSVNLNDKKAEELVRSDYPCVFCNRRLKLKKAAFIASKNKEGAKLAVNHLIEKGHKRIAYISGPNNLSTASERLEGFYEAMKEKGLQIEKKYIKQGPFSKEISYKLTNELLSTSPVPTAIFASNDLIALASMEIIKEKGYRIPEDIALIGYDNIDISGHRNILLTTIAQKKKKWASLL
ncbi:LacI family DNA-binding transcriptional regulator [Natranaerofaba carboxydovora]|uniref:LacI family DNA-binding transcriptional regulator n=1 Tax=Natranaerofaba carboxydovora TaxID=2742683 RepID=UPI001F141998|nr:LacI family DNA-binding transcriptional regulator [Natranaerofaba carboxydovora]UMZ73632.1 Catabolite control protein A [Natranaerofaba carboxydovora]